MEDEVKVIKGQHLHVNHSRKGKFDAIALRNFDTDSETFYPLVVAKGSFVQGTSAATYWLPSEEISCRNSLCTIEIAE